MSEERAGWARVALLLIVVATAIELAVALTGTFYVTGEYRPLEATFLAAAMAIGVALLILVERHMDGRIIQAFLATWLAVAMFAGVGGHTYWAGSQLLTELVLWLIIRSAARTPHANSLSLALVGEHHEAPD